MDVSADDPVDRPTRAQPALAPSGARSTRSATTRISGCRLTARKSRVRRCQSRGGIRVLTLDASILSHASTGTPAAPTSTDPLTRLNLPLTKYRPILRTL